MKDFKSPAKMDFKPSPVPTPPSFAKRPAPKTFSERIHEWTLEYRFLFVIPILLPASLAFTTYQKSKTFINLTFGKYFRNHEGNVKSIQAQIKKWKESGSENLLCTARPSFLSVSNRDQDYKRPDNSIVLQLFDILNFNEENRTITVEPGVSVGQVTSFLNPKGWTLAVIPELDELTFGGLFNGHKYGLLNDIVVSADVVLGDASVVTCSETENQDLFRAIPWSHGSLGFLVSLTLNVVPCKKYIRLIYEPIYSIDEMTHRFTEIACAENPVGFLEAVQYDFNKGVLTYGDFADEVGTDGVKNSIGLWYKKWWHAHAQTYLENGKSGVEYIPVRDYYHRHTKSIFWEMELILPMGNHWLFRYLLGWMMPPSIAFLKGTQTKEIKEHYQDAHIAQDYLLPISKLKESIIVSHELYDIYPLWLCPHAVFKTSPQGAIRAPLENAEIEMYVDLGIWYSPGPWIRGEFFEGRKATRAFEKWLRDNRGYQATYACSEQSRGEFFEMFDGELYEKCRVEYGAKGVFMDSYDKVHGKIKNK